MNIAIVLAGGKLTKDFSLDINYKALLEYKDKTLLDIVLDAVKGSNYIDKIILVSPKEVSSALKEDRLSYIYKIVSSGDTLFSSFKNGLSVLPENANYILILPSDLPFIESEHIDKFFSLVLQSNLNLAYSYLKKEVSEKKFKDLRHTYVKFKEGYICGGSFFIFKSIYKEVILDKAEFILKNRKNPYIMSKILGLNLIIKLLFGQLSIKEVENKVSEILSIKNIKALECEFAETGFNIDKKEDYIYLNNLSF